MAMLFSCETNQTAEKELTFEDIEKEFGFERPLSDISRNSILTKFSSLENYRDFLSKANKNVETNSLNCNKLKGGIQYCLKLISAEIGSQTGNYIYEIGCDEDEGLDLPYPCRAGACNTCVAHCAAGTYDDSDQCFLDTDQQDRGFLLTCVTYPTFDGTYFTHYEDRLY